MREKTISHHIFKPADLRTIPIIRSGRAKRQGTALNASMTVLILVAILHGCAAKLTPPQPTADKTAQSTPNWHCSVIADDAMKNGDIAMGLREHARFVADHPHNPLAHYHLGYAYGQTGDIDQEIAHYEAAVSLGYTHDDQLFFNLAMAYGEVNRFDDAVSAFEKVLMLVPNATDALFQLSLIYQEMGDAGKERRSLERYLNLKPDDDAVRQRLNELRDD